MKGSTLRVCLVLLFLLVGAGIPAAASPSISSISPATGPLGGGTFTITITGSGFDSVYKVLLYRCGSKYGTSGVMGGTNLQVSANTITAQIDLSGTSVVSGDYDVLLYSNEGVNYKLESFNIYGGSTPVPATTTYGPVGPYGTLYIETSPPGAVIFVNGGDKGNSPVTLTGIWPGTYTISAKLAGYQECFSVTTLSGSQYSPVYCRLVPDSSGNGLYVVSTPAKANVYVDGVLAGVTPFMQSNIVTGTHIIQVRLSGYDEWKSTVEIPKNGSKTISALLNQTDTVVNQGIHVASIPVGATIALDGRTRGVTPKTLNNIAAGIHILEINYPGYTSWKSTIDVPETEIKDISVNLTPKTSPPGWITVSSNPGNASVTLDGSYVGRTIVNSSLNLDTITPGEHIIALELPGYQPFSTRINVSSHLVSSVNAVLVPASVAFAKGALSVTSDPAGATISVDNRSLGQSPLTAGDITAGNHRVTITFEGFQDYSTSILVTPGNTSTVSATLLPVTPSLKTPLSPSLSLGALGIISLLFFLRRPE